MYQIKRLQRDIFNIYLKLSKKCSNVYETML